MSVANADFELFRAFLKKAYGIALGSSGQYLASSRLNKLMKQQSIKGLGELVQRIQTQRGGLREMVTDAMITNETPWFRDTCPFEVLKQQVLLGLIKANGGQRLRIWSAARSPGQEPYSLSMVIDEFEKINLGQLKAGVQIVATDLSGLMLTAAKTGEYGTLVVGRDLSPERLQRHFDAEGPGRWAVKLAIRSRVELRALNLLNSYVSLGRFDMVLRRNVLIYFFAGVKRNIPPCIHGTFKPGGYLSLDASEALNNLLDHYQMVQCSPGITYRAKQRKEADPRQVTPGVAWQPGADPLGTGRQDETFALCPGSERHARRRRRGPFGTGRLVRSRAVQDCAIQLY